MIAKTFLQYEVAGLVSGGVASVCGDVDVPGIFVRINHPDIFHFIQSALKQSIEGVSNLFQLQWKTLNVITDNVIYWFMYVTNLAKAYQNFLRYHRH